MKEEVKDYAYYLRESYGDKSKEILKWVKTERKFTGRDARKINYTADNSSWPRKTK